MDTGLEFQKNILRIRINILYVCVCVCVCVCVLVYVSVCICVCAKQIALTFSNKIFLKKDLGLEIQKTNVRIKIIILKILCQFSGKMNNSDSFFYNITSLENIDTR